MVFYQSKLRDWIDINKLDWKYLSINSNAIELLKINQDKIDWNYLSINPNNNQLSWAVGQGVAGISNVVGTAEQIISTVNNNIASISLSVKLGNKFIAVLLYSLYNLFA